MGSSVDSEFLRFRLLLRPQVLPGVQQLLFDEVGEATEEAVGGQDGTVQVRPAPQAAGEQGAEGGGGGDGGGDGGDGGDAADVDRR